MFEANAVLKLANDELMNITQNMRRGTRKNILLNPTREMRLNLNKLKLAKVEIKLFNQYRIRRLKLKK
jgi:hypothetical protein